jgi:hypothetical protein
MYIGALVQKVYVFAEAFLQFQEFVI